MFANKWIILGHSSNLDSHVFDASFAHLLETKTEKKRESRRKIDFNKN